MRVLCLDVGDRRIGLAVSDPSGLLATPTGFIKRTGLRQDIGKVIEHAAQRQAESIVVGMPLSLNGMAGPQAKRVEAFVNALRVSTELPVDTKDERFSTAEAERLLQQAGRLPCRSKGDVDAAAAAVILQDYLNVSSGSR